MIGPLFVVLGVLLLLGGGSFWLHEHRWSSKAAHAQGIVTELEAQRQSDGEITYSPHVRFSLPDGSSVQFTTHSGSNPPSFHAGDPVPVAYSAQNPNHAAIATTWGIYDASIVLAILGVFFFDIGFGLVWYRKRRVKKMASFDQSKLSVEQAQRNVRAANFWGGGRPQ